MPNSKGLIWIYHDNVCRAARDNRTHSFSILWSIIRVKHLFEIDNYIDTMDYLVVKNVLSKIWFHAQEDK